MLIKDIEQKRRQLVDTANKYGLSSTKTLKISQELDYLLDKYQHKKAKRFYKNIC